MRQSSLGGVEERVQGHGNPQRPGADVKQHEHESEKDDLHRLLAALVEVSEAEADS